MMTLCHLGAFAYGSGSANEKEGTSVSQMTPVFIVKALKCQACGGREVFDEVILK